jgi:hypothetical protein
LAVKWTVPLTECVLTGVGDAQGADLGAGGTVGADNEARAPVWSVSVATRPLPALESALAWTKRGEPGLDESVLGSAVGHDLLEVALPGPQRFVTGLRSTADVFSHFRAGLRSVLPAARRRVSDGPGGIECKVTVP